MPALCRVCLSHAHETSNCPFIYYSSNVTAAKPDKPVQKSYSGAPSSGKLVDDARKAEEETSRAKREEDEHVRREERAPKEKLERDRKEEEKDRKEKE